MTFEEFFEAAGRYLFAPFTSLETFLYALTGALRTVSDLGSKTAWPYLLSSLFIAAAIWWIGRRRGLIDSGLSLRAFLFPRAIYRHPSAMLDYRYLVVNQALAGVVYAPLFAGLSYLLYKILYHFISGVLPGGLGITTSIAGVAAITVIGFVVTDFTFFLTHYLAHNVPVLWYFHQVHHSAQVLTPVTVFRSHPIDGLVSSLLSAVTGALYSAIVGQEVRPMEFFGLNVILLAFFVMALQLRHSHIWLSYGSILNRIVISPAQHQIHHSTDPKHFRKNYGFVLAVWDGLFNSLYVPRSREKLQFGLADCNAKDFQTIRDLYVQPFVNVVRHCRRRHTVDATPEHHADAPLHLQRDRA